MVDLDSPGTYQAYDGAGMGEHIRRLPAQCQRAWEQAQGMPLPSGREGIERVVVVGMGGSAIGGDLCSALAALEGKLMLVHRSYGPLPFLTPGTLTIFSSYSGNTEETLSALESSLTSPARKLAFTSGGKLREVAQRHGIPVYSIDYTAPPRAVLGFSFIGLLGVLCRIGFLKDKAGELRQALQIMEKWVERLGFTQPLPRNPAKQLAGSLHGRLALLYGAGFLEPVARRWKAQLNENSKAWAFAEALPELNHNSVVGYPFPSPQAGGSFAVLLSSPLLHPRLLRRYEITGEILQKAGVKFQVVEGQGDSPLSQMLTLILWGDFVSYYLAMIYETDPSPTPVIAYLKERMGQYGLQVR